MRDWDACYRNDETPWDKGTAAPPLEELMRDYGRAIFLDGPVLVPGCGFGHDVRWLAEFGVPAHGVDISATAVEKAISVTQIVAATFEVGDFLDATWRVGRQYTAIWEHTCFCAIHPESRACYARAAADLLAPGGFLAGVFYITPKPNIQGHGCPPFKVSVDELHALFAPWFERVEGKIPTLAYPGREGREWLTVYRKLSQPRVAE